MDLNNRHASLKAHTENGEIVMTCTNCGAHYEKLLQSSIFSDVQLTGKCYACGAVLDGEEKNDCNVVRVEMDPAIPEAEQNRLLNKMCAEEAEAIAADIYRNDVE